MRLINLTILTLRISLYQKNHSLLKAINCIYTYKIKLYVHMQHNEQRIDIQRPIINHYEKNKRSNRRTGKRHEQAFQKKRKHENY